MEMSGFHPFSSCLLWQELKGLPTELPSPISETKREKGETTFFTVSLT